MKPIRKFLFLAALLISSLGAYLSFANSSVDKVNAASEKPTPRNGQSGSILLVNGSGTYFKSGEADLAICCWDNSSYAWSERVSYRVSGDLIRVMIPYLGDQSKTWSNFKVCRYNPGLDPRTSGDSGVYHETDTIQFSSMLYDQNTVNITGYGEGNKLNHAINYNPIYGILGESHMYLDLSGFTDWENDGAKFAIYFACPAQTNNSDWSKANAIGNAYYSSFCWKVNGQNNDHLYECIVPNFYVNNSRNIWNLVIAVRFGAEASSPNWDDHKCNQTGDLSFNSSNENANMIHISGWNDGYIDSENIISDESRVNFYGNYFLNTVSCSGSGNSDATTSEMWNTVKYEYQTHLSRLTQGTVWTTEGNKNGNAIEQAIARYDYIVLYKEYNHEDFINRKDSPNKTEYSAFINFLSITKNNDLAIILISTIAISIVSISMYFIVKRIKAKEHK